MDQKKSFIQKFWWLLVIIGIGLIFLAMVVISGARHDGSENRGNKGFFGAFDNSKEFNERIVKTFVPESGAAFKYNSPMLNNGYLYLGTSEKTGYDNMPPSEISDNYFYKMDLEFNIIWQHPLQKKMVTGGAVMDSDDNIYFLAELVTENPNFDANTEKDKEHRYFSQLELFSLTPDGNLRWQRSVSPEVEYWSRSMLGVAISADDLIYFCNNRFYAFNSDGNQVGQYPDDNRKIIGSRGAPVIDSAGNIYFAASEPVELSQEFATETFKAYKFSPRLASLVWSTTMGNEVMSELDPNYTPRKGLGIESTPSLGVDEKSLVGIIGSTISKFDTATGELLWATKPEGIIGYITASPAIDGDDNIYVGSKSNQYSKFFAIKSDGTLLWRRDIGADLYNSPILGDDNAIYVGSETVPKPSGKFHVLDRLTGDIKWEIGTDDEKKIPDFSVGSGLLYKGYIYIGVHSGKEGDDKSFHNEVLFKIKVDAYDYLPGAVWPRIHGGNNNSGRIQ
ncbi:MAG: PQQ-binding-like beta-propeller repeat protein [Patescibacteria group bacterium]